MPVSSPAWSEILTCSVCTKAFDSVNNLPVSLECGHVVCLSCLSQLRTDACPFDQTPLPHSRDVLPVSLPLVKIITSDFSDSVQQPTAIQEALSNFIGEDMFFYYLEIEAMLCILASHLRKTPSERGASVWSPTLSRALQRKLLTMLTQGLIGSDEARLKMARACRALGERCLSEILLVQQNPNHLTSNLWAAVRARGCQFLGPAMQEEVLKLILLTLSDGAYISRKNLVMYVVQNLEKEYPQASKTSVGHVVQLLYRASCFNVLKRDGESSLMQLKEEFRNYETLRREHDSQLVQIAQEAGLRISQDQWSALLYGDQSHRSHMQSIIDKLQTPASFGLSIQEWLIVLQRNGDPDELMLNRPHFERLSGIDSSLDCSVPPPSWSALLDIIISVQVVLEAQVQYCSQASSSKDSLASGRFKTMMCRDVTESRPCPRGDACTFAHSAKELASYRYHARSMQNTRGPIRKTTSDAAVRSGESYLGLDRAGGLLDPGNEDEEWILPVQARHERLAKSRSGIPVNRVIPLQNSASYGPSGSRRLSVPALSPSSMLLYGNSSRSSLTATQSSGGLHRNLLTHSRSGAGLSQPGAAVTSEAIPLYPQYRRASAPRISPMSRIGENHPITSGTGRSSDSRSKDGPAEVPAAVQQLFAAAAAGSPLSSASQFSRSPSGGQSVGYGITPLIEVDTPVSPPPEGSEDRFFSNESVSSPSSTTNTTTYRIPYRRANAHQALARSATVDQSKSQEGTNNGQDNWREHGEGIKRSITRNNSLPPPGSVSFQVGSAGPVTPSDTVPSSPSASKTKISSSVGGHIPSSPYSSSEREYHEAKCNQSERDVQNVQYSGVNQAAGTNRISSVSNNRMVATTGGYTTASPPTGIRPSQPTLQYPSLPSMQVVDPARAPPIGYAIVQPMGPMGHQQPMYTPPDAMPGPHTTPPVAWIPTGEVGGPVNYYYVQQSHVMPTGGTLAEVPLPPEVACGPVTNTPCGPSAQFFATPGGLMMAGATPVCGIQQSPPSITMPGMMGPTGVANTGMVALQSTPDMNYPGGMAILSATGAPLTTPCEPHPRDYAVPPAGHPNTVIVGGMPPRVMSPVSSPYLYHRRPDYVTMQGVNIPPLQGPQTHQQLYCIQPSQMIRNDAVLPGSTANVDISQPNSCGSTSAGPLSMSVATEFQHGLPNLTFYVPAYPADMPSQLKLLVNRKQEIEKRLHALQDKDSRFSNANFAVARQTSEEDEELNDLSIKVASSVLNDTEDQIYFGAARAYKIAQKHVELQSSSSRTTQPNVWPPALFPGFTLNSSRYSGGWNGEPACWWSSPTAVNCVVPARGLVVCTTTVASESQNIMHATPKSAVALISSQSSGPTGSLAEVEDDLWYLSEELLIKELSELPTASKRANLIRCEMDRRKCERWKGTSNSSDDYVPITVKYNKKGSSSGSSTMWGDSVGYKPVSSNPVLSTAVHLGDTCTYLKDSIRPPLAAVAVQPSKCVEVSREFVDPLFITSEIPAVFRTANSIRLRQTEVDETIARKLEIQDRIRTLVSSQRGQDNSSTVEKQQLRHELHALACQISRAGLGAEEECLVKELSNICQNMDNLMEDQS